MTAVFTDAARAHGLVSGKRGRSCRSALVALAGALAIAGGSLPLHTGLEASRPEEPRQTVAPGYTIEGPPADADGLRARFSPEQLAALEQINRADLNHLPRLPVLAVPDTWSPNELVYSQMPERYEAAAALAQTLVVHVPGQMFGAYEHGTLVRWGAVSTGARSSPTPAGLFFLTWKSLGHTSSVNPTWYMRWYFNFDSRAGLAFHEYALPGVPASHGCIRLLERDAVWLYGWGEQWRANADWKPEVTGTPVLVVGAYDFGAPPPWRSPQWLGSRVTLPPLQPVPPGT